MPTESRASSKHPGFDELVEVIWRLRQPDGCPWDRAQTHASIAKNMVEEAYEVQDAIEGAGRHLAEELGDVLMQVVLQSQIAEDDGEFSIDDVCQGIVEKLIRRHPHVFGDEHAQNADEVLGLWDRVKVEEHRRATQDQELDAREGLLDSVPTALPALMAAQKISRKAVSVGFDWDSTEDVWKQVQSEITEFETASRGSAAAEMEFGDILFALVNVARREGIDAESALRASNAKFRARWSYMERAAWQLGRDMRDLDRAEQEALWVEAKSKECEL